MSSESTAATPARSPVFVASVIVNGVLAVGLVIVAALYFQATTELAATKAELAKEVARAAELKTDLNSARIELQSLAAQSTKLKSEMEAKEQVLAKEKSRAESATTALEREKARLPAVPVRVEFRRSAMGRGLVGIFSNYSSKQLPVVIALHNPTTGLRKQLSIQIAPGSRAELGYLEGWQFASGDQVAIGSAGHEALRVTVP
jgi:uncharacterized membrane-anchored protein YhcB (DUF1043 family)